jgi:hypothetical protein
MNSLTLGFYYTAGLAWVLAECCIQASAGNSLPLVIYSIGFIVIFGILGCLDLPDKTINLTGTILAAVLGLVLLAFSFASWKTSGTIIGLPKTLVALTFLAASFSGLIGGGSKKEQEAGGH